MTFHPEDFINPLVRDLPLRNQKIFDLVSEMKDVISLGVGEPDFISPWHVQKPVFIPWKKAIPCTLPISACRNWRYEIAKYLDQRFGVPYNDQKDYCHRGASEAVDMALRTIAAREMRLSSGTLLRIL